MPFFCFEHPNKTGVFFWLKTQLEKPDSGSKCMIFFFNIRLKTADVLASPVNYLWKNPIFRFKKTER